MNLPFKNARALEDQIDQFLDIIVRSVLVLKEGISSFLKDDAEEFANRIQQIVALESDADDLRKTVEAALYTYSLIPESRGDVLGLLENMDNLADKSKMILQRLDVECPRIEPEFREVFRDLTDKTVLAVECVVSASRAYFTDVDRVKEFIAKVAFYESEADHYALKLKRQVFGSNLELVQKMHLRYFIEEIEALSDMAEGVGERLSIAAIKRSV